MGFGGVGMILFLGVIIVAVVMLGQWKGGTSSASPPNAGTKTALDILRERYAKGEIDKEEFEQKQRDLG